MSERNRERERESTVPPSAIIENKTWSGIAKRSSRRRRRRRKENGNGWRRIGERSGLGRGFARQKDREKLAPEGAETKTRLHRSRRPNVSKESRERRTDREPVGGREKYIYIYRKREEVRRKGRERDGEIFTRTKRKQKDERARE